MEKPPSSGKCQCQWASPPGELLALSIVSTPFERETCAGNQESKGKNPLLPDYLFISID
jgi:hypothetical protein